MALALDEIEGVSESLMSNGVNVDTSIMGPGGQRDVKAFAHKQLGDELLELSPVKRMEQLRLLCKHMNEGVTYLRKRHFGCPQLVAVGDGVSGRIEHGWLIDCWGYRLLPFNRKRPLELPKISWGNVQLMRNPIIGSTHSNPSSDLVERWL